MNSRRKPYEGGFTLVELMMSIFVSSIVLLASGSIMALITGQWERGMDRVELAAETALTIERIVREIRSSHADSVSVSANGDTLKIGGGIRFYRTSTNDIMGENSGGADMVYLEGMATGFTAIKPYINAAGDTLANMVKVILILQKDTIHDTTSMMAIPRPS